MRPKVALLIQPWRRFVLVGLLLVAGCSSDGDSPGESVVETPTEATEAAVPTATPSPTAEPTQVPEPPFDGDPVLTPRDLPGETESPVAVLGPGPVPPGAIAGSFKDDLTIEQISEGTIEITFNALPTRRDPSDPCAWWYGAFLARADDGEVRVWLRSYYVPDDVPCEEPAPRQILQVTNTALDDATAIVPGPLPTPDG